MEATQALRQLAELTASQWGMVTTAQAIARGVTRLQVSRLSTEGCLERVSRGIYRDSGAPAERFDALKAAWLSIDPRRTAWERLADKPPDAVVSGATASYLLNIGDLVPEPYEFTVPTRRQTQRTELRYRVRELPPESLTMREGLLVTTPEQTIADLVEARMDLSLVADVLSDTEALDSRRLADLLSPLAQRNGFERGDGAALLADLERLAHRDVDSLARVVSGTPLAREITRQHLSALDPAAVAAVMGEAIAKSGALVTSATATQAIGSAQAMLREFTEATSRLPILQGPPSHSTTASTRLLEALVQLPVLQAPVDDRTRRRLISTAERMRQVQRMPDEPTLAAMPEEVPEKP